MEERKQDPRIYVVSTIFLAFILCGGTFLALYIFLPTDQIKDWYPTVGLTLIAIPWAFWFFTYIYRCIRPESRPPQPPKSYPAEAEAAAAPTSLDDQQSLAECASDEARHLRFGGVVVVTEDDNNNNGGKQDNVEEGVIQPSSVEQDHSYGTASHDNSINSRESEIPLAQNRSC